MKVSDIMTKAPACCAPATNLGSAVEILWNGNCGILPVVDTHGRVVSVITDRDICIALGTGNRLPGEVTVGDVASWRAICCGADEDIRSAVATMAEAKVRRLPVVDADGKIEGLLSIDDVVDRADRKARVKADELTSKDVVSALKMLYAARLPETVPQATDA